MTAGTSAASDYESWTKAQLVDRIRLLEANQLSQKQEGSETESKVQKTNANKKKKTVPAKIKSRKRKFDFSKYETRFVAFRFAYLGWNYNGLSYQQEPTPLPTVEEQILNAMAKSKMITNADPYCCDFSRCGRTDKGVSALNQVISLNIRSALSKEDQTKKEMDLKEIPYVSILNAVLPTDIRITAVCLRPPSEFDARFSCISRHYKYLFLKDGLDTEKMQAAAALYEGTHDFRNFCKIDGSKQISSYVREILSAKIMPYKDNYYVFDLQGNGFLWHQVRCMIGILFLVGQKHEEVSIISDLLDILKYPSRPTYAMANDVPLVLYNCLFPEMEWLTLENDFEGAYLYKLRREYPNFRGLLLDYQVKAHMARMMAETYLQSGQITDTNSVNLGDGTGRPSKNYIPLSRRERGGTVEDINQRHREKVARKLAEVQATETVLLESKNPKIPDNSENPLKS